MNPIKKILVPVDFSETSDYALDAAIDLAGKYGAAVVLLHTYEIPVFGFPDGAMVATAEIATRIMTGAQAALAAAVESRKNRGVALESILRQGVAWTEVNSVAEETRADMIVMGTHGRRGIQRALLGSVAEKVVRTAPIPVLTVRLPSTHESKTAGKEVRT